MGLRAGLVLALASSLAYASPAAPSLVGAPRTFVAFAGATAPVQVSWLPVDGAARYRVTWSDGPTSDGGATAAARDLRSGAYRVSVVAIAADGSESPATEAAIEIVGVEAVAPGALVPSATASRAFAVGARFRSAGLTCALGNQRGVEVIATQPGAFSLRCGREIDRPTVDVPVVITPIHVAADTAPIARDVPTQVHVTVASTAPIGDALTVEASGPLHVGLPVRTRGGFDVQVTAHDSGIGHVVIKAGAIELGRVALDLVDAPLPATPEQVTTEWAAFDVGAVFGGLFTPGEGTAANLLGRPTDSDDTIKTGPTVGVHLGLFPTRRLGLEAEVALASMGYEARQGIAPVLVSRGQIAVRLVEDGRLGLRAVAGATWLSLLSSAGTSSAGSLGSVHYGGAFTVETRRDISLRFQALHLITVAQDAGYANCIELSAGVVVRLGRRDRWK